MTTEAILKLASDAFGIFTELRGELQARGVPPERLAAITADYDARIAAADAAAADPVPPAGE